MSASISYLPYFVGAYTKTYSIQEKGHPCTLYIHEDDSFYISGSYVSRNLRNREDAQVAENTDGRITRNLRKPFDLTDLTAVLESLGFIVYTSSGNAHTRSHAIWYLNRYLGRIYG